MGKKTFGKIGKSRKLNINLNDNNVSDTTKDVLEDLTKSYSKEKLETAIEVVNNDKYLSKNMKYELLLELQSNYIDLVNFENCPDDYNELKKEAKFLAEMTQYSFLLLAQRLWKIKKEKLYLEDGYFDFKSFVEYEIKTSRRTAYNYIDLIDLFGVQVLAHQEGNLSKLIPYLPILKSDNIDIPKEDIKGIALKEISKKSFKEISNDAKEIKSKYGIGKITKNHNKWIDDFQNKVLDSEKNLTTYEKDRLIILADYLYKHFK